MICPNSAFACLSFMRVSSSATSALNSESNTDIASNSSIRNIKRNRVFPIFQKPDSNDFSRPTKADAITAPQLGNSLINNKKNGDSPFKGRAKSWTIFLRLLASLFYQITVSAPLLTVESPRFKLIATVNGFAEFLTLTLIKRFCLYD